MMVAIDILVTLHLVFQNVYQPKEVKKIDWQLYANEAMNNSEIKSSVLFELNSIGLDDLTVLKLSDLLTRR